MNVKYFKAWEEMKDELKKLRMEVEELKKRDTPMKPVIKICGKSDTDIQQKIDNVIFEMQVHYHETVRLRVLEGRVIAKELKGLRDKIEKIFEESSKEVKNESTTYDEAFNNLLSYFHENKPLENVDDTLIKIEKGLNRVNKLEELVKLNEKKDTILHPLDNHSLEEYYALIRKINKLFYELEEMK